MIRAASWLSLVLTVAGIGVSIYLVWAHYDMDALVCGIGDCVEVQSSDYSKVFGIPVALLGLLMYVSLLGLMIARVLRPEWSELATGIIFGISLAGTLYSAYLTYIEIWEIEAICQWCVVSAILTLAIFLIETTQMWTQGQDDPA